VNGWLLITANRKGRCIRCRKPIRIGTAALYNPQARTIAHASCKPPERA